VDYNDLVKIPYFKREIEALTNEAGRLRYHETADLGSCFTTFCVNILGAPVGRGGWARTRMFL